MNTISKDGEKALVSCVNEVIGLVGEGSHPTDALEKLAVDKALTPQQIRRVAEAYNQSRTLFELGEKQGQDRLQPFAIANPDTVVDNVFPAEITHPTIEKAASVIYDYYNQDTTALLEKAARETLRATKAGVEKQASNDPGDADEKSRKKTYAEKCAAFRQTKEAEMAYIAAKEKVGYLMYSAPEQLGAELLKAGSCFEDFDKAVLSRYSTADDTQKAIVNFLGMACQHVKAANYASISRTFGSMDATNQTLIDLMGPARAVTERLFDAAADMHKKASQYRNSSKRLKELDERTGACVTKKSEAREEPKSNFLEKIAEGGMSSFFPLTSGALSATQMFRPPKSDTTYNKTLNSTLFKLNNPTNRDNMHQVRVQAMMNEFLTDDEVLSGYDPEEVIEAFNSIAATTPGITESKPFMRDTLRRYLIDGGLQSLEIGQAAQVAKSLQENQKLYADTYTSDIRDEPARKEGL